MYDSNERLSHITDTKNVTFLVYAPLQVYPLTLTLAHVTPVTPVTWGGQ